MQNANMTNITNIDGRAHFIAYSDSKQAHMMAGTDSRTIVQHFRAPARAIAVNINADAWTTLRQAGIPEQYAGLLERVIDNAAQSILKRYAEGFTLLPSSVPCDLFTSDAIMAEAIGNNSEWMSKDELTAAWEQSATRKRYVTDTRYASSVDYRKAVNAYAEMILKLAGKTVSYTPDQLDVIVAKLHSDDLETPLGSFVLRRVEALKNKKPNEAPDLMALL